MSLGTQQGVAGMMPNVKTFSKRAVDALIDSDPEFVRFVDMLYGPVAKRGSLVPTDPDGTMKRKVTTGLSVVGAGAGAYGLGLGAADIRTKGLKAGAQGFRNIARTGFKAQATHMKVLAPLEAAGLAGEISSAHILHGDTKRKQPLAKSDLPKVDDEVKGALHSYRQLLPERFLKPGKHAKPLKEVAEHQKAIGGFMGDAVNYKGRTAAVVGGGLLVARHERNKGRKEGYQATAYSKRAPEVEWAGTFSKFDDDKRQAFGYASVVKKNGMPVIDRQGDYVTPEDMETAAYVYVQKSRKGGDMHRRTVDVLGQDAPYHVSDLIESVVFTPEKCQAMGMPEEVAKSLEGHWWVGYQIHDENTWAEVKKGGRAGFSIHGRGKREETSVDKLMAYPR